MRPSRLFSSSVRVQPDFDIGNNILPSIQFLYCSRIPQFAWWALFGFLAIDQVRSALSGNLDCFMQLGAFRVCGVTQQLSIYTSLFLLMTQALVSRVLVPGMSNFVNSSVRRLYLCDDAPCAHRLTVFPDGYVTAVLFTAPPHTRHRYCLTMWLMQSAVSYSPMSKMAQIVRSRTMKRTRAAGCDAAIGALPCAAGRRAVCLQHEFFPVP